MMSEIKQQKKTEKAAPCTVGTQTDILKVSNFGPVINTEGLPINFEKLDN